MNCSGSAIFSAKASFLYCKSADVCPPGTGGIKVASQLLTFGRATCHATFKQNTEQFKQTSNIKTRARTSLEWLN